MLTLSDMGATILPPTPAFYTHPVGIDDIVEYTAVRILDQLGLDVESPSRWSGLRAPDEDEPSFSRTRGEADGRYQVPARNGHVNVTSLVAERRIS